MIVGLIFFLSIIQSLLGMGLLLLGTPVALTLGLNYEQCLYLLLPPSISISLSQVIPERKTIDLRPTFYYLLPALASGHIISHVIYHPPARLMNSIVLVMISLVLVLRLFRKSSEWLSSFFSRMNSLPFVAIGLVHGVSNLGGSLLAILAVTRYREQDERVVFIAQNYLFMAATQYAILLLTKPIFFERSLLFTAVPMALLVYKLIKWKGIVVNMKASNMLFNGLLMTAVILLLKKII